MLTTRSRCWLFHIDQSIWDVQDTLTDLRSKEYVKDLQFTLGEPVTGYIQFKHQLSYGLVFRVMPDSTKIKSTIYKDLAFYQYCTYYDDYLNKYQYKYKDYIQKHKNKRLK